MRFRDVGMPWRPWQQTCIGFNLRIHRVSEVISWALSACHVLGFLRSVLLEINIVADCAYCCVLNKLMMAMCSWLVTFVWVAFIVWCIIHKCFWFCDVWVDCGSSVSLSRRPAPSNDSKSKLCIGLNSKSNTHAMCFAGPLVQDCLFTTDAFLWCAQSLSVRIAGRQKLL